VRPSLSPDLFNHLRYVEVLTKLGSRTTGLNMIDAVRALRRTFPDVSDRWVAVGDSQGTASGIVALSARATKEIGPKDFTPRTPEAPCSSRTAGTTRPMPTNW
jgi:hypothetical protein